MFWTQVNIALRGTHVTLRERQLTTNAQQTQKGLRIFDIIIYQKTPLTLIEWLQIVRKVVEVWR